MAAEILRQITWIKTLERSKQYSELETAHDKLGQIIGDLAELEGILL
jgi:hypothetical protein